MQRLFEFGRTFSNLLPLLLATLAFILLVVTPAMAQLTQEDIDRLREQGKQEGWTFEVGLSEISKYPLEQICGFKEPPDAGSMAPQGKLSFLAAPMPVRFDWRDYDGVTPPKNQGQCGSCWAFATCSAVEAAIKVTTGQTVDLSEQWLLSCNRSGYDCTGGWYAYDYFIDEGSFDECHEYGGVLEKYMTYAGNDAIACNCPYPRDHWINAWYYIGSSKSVADTDSIKAGLLEWGPVAVGVYVNDAFQGYRSGIFNGCENNESVNHSVLIVGWDDDFEESGVGVWIMKNSWGPDWGVDGYMYIPYGCSKIGYATSFADCGQQGIYFAADTTIGYVPFDVNFESFSSLEIDTWTWDFGDGGISYDEFASHTYNDWGSFDVSLEINAGGDIRTNIKEKYIIAIADTIRGENVPANPGTQIEFVVEANNSARIEYIKFPFEFANNFGMVFDSFSTVGCRTEYFEIQDYLHWDLAGNQRATLRFVTSNIGTSPDLDPGQGTIVKLYFTIPDTATVGQSAWIELDGYLSFLPAYSGDYVNYLVPGINGQVTLGEGCCILSGDANHNGLFDILDVDFLLAYLLRGGAEPFCFEEIDVDHTGLFDILDVDYLLDYLYRGGPEPLPCP